MSIKILCDICGEEVDEDELPAFSFQPAEGPSLVIWLDIRHQKGSGQQKPDICGGCQKEFLRDFAWAYAPKDKKDDLEALIEKIKTKVDFALANDVDEPNDRESLCIFRDEAEEIVELIKAHKGE